MKKYKFKVAGTVEEFDLEDKDFLLITAIDNLTKELYQTRVNGR